MLSFLGFGNQGDRGDFSESPQRAAVVIGFEQVLTWMWWWLLGLFACMHKHQLKDCCFCAIGIEDLHSLQVNPIMCSPFSAALLFILCLSKHWKPLLIIDQCLEVLMLDKVVSFLPYSWLRVMKKFCPSVFNIELGLLGHQQPSAKESNNWKKVLQNPTVFLFMMLLEVERNRVFTFILEKWTEPFCCFFVGFVYFGVFGLVWGCVFLGSLSRRGSQCRCM